MESKCIHNFIITAWEINTHSHIAKEVTCEKCLCSVQHEDLMHLRNTHSLKVSITPKDKVDDIVVGLTDMANAVHDANEQF